MGRLKDALTSIRKRKGYSNSLTGWEMVEFSSLVIHLSAPDIHIAKNRYGATGFVSLPDVIKDIINAYTADANNFTPSKMFNVIIGKEIEEAVRNILIKHKLSN